eukprot:8612653-Pyramimonas_sp.AAC.1
MRTSSGRATLLMGQRPPHDEPEERSPQVAPEAQSSEACIHAFVGVSQVASAQTTTPNGLVL